MFYVLVSKGCQYCECIITATDTPGHYSFPVQCTIINSSNSDPSHELLIKGYTQVHNYYMYMYHSGTDLLLSVE